MINNIYTTPVLFSGLSSLILKSTEITMIDQYLKQTVQRLQKLMDKTPACIVAFLGGQLPGTALLHLKQLSLFGMISRLPGNCLHLHAKHILTSARPSSSSWFQQVRDLCLLYQLDHTLSILQNPPKKDPFNRLIKSSIIDHWETKLREKASSLTSAPYFKPEYMSLTRPHPLWFSCGSNSFESHKAVQTSRMLSGRYLTDRLQRHWTQNRDGFCLLPACSPARSLGSLEHLLLHCSSLKLTRDKMMRLCNKVSTENQDVANILLPVLNSGIEKTTMQILLDCTTIPSVIRTTQEFGPDTRDKILYLGRTWCYSIHRERMNQMGLFSFR